MAGETVVRVAFGGDRSFELFIQAPGSAAEAPAGKVFDEWADRL